MLTGTDETELLIPLFAAAAGEVQFSLFLERLRRRTGADRAALRIDGETIASGGGDAGLEQLLAPAQLRPSRVYALSEMSGADELAGDARVLRLPVAEFGAWLAVSGGRAFGAPDSALLSALAPFAAIAVRQHLAARRRVEADELTATALARGATGWILLDAQAQIVAFHPVLEAPFAAAGLRPREGAALPGVGAVLGGLPCVVQLNARPGIEALILPAKVMGATALALCRIGREQGAQAAALLARFAGLSPREAEFALALAAGNSIAEAGVAMGLSLETARNYSKQVYAKTGTRGQANLVRRLLGGAIALA